jgi:hypothetical protein
MIECAKSSGGFGLCCLHTGNRFRLQFFFIPRGDVHQLKAQLFRGAGL